MTSPSFRGAQARIQDRIPGLLHRPGMTDKMTKAKMPQTIHRGIKSLIDEANAAIEPSARLAIKAAGPGS
jgi:hypothetical protein